MSDILSILGAAPADAAGDTTLRLAESATPLVGDQFSNVFLSLTPAALPTEPAVAEEDAADEQPDLTAVQSETSGSDEAESQDAPIAAADSAKGEEPDALAAQNDAPVPLAQDDDPVEAVAKMGYVAIVPQSSDTRVVHPVEAVVRGVLSEAKPFASRAPEIKMNMRQEQPVASAPVDAAAEALDHSEKALLPRRTEAPMPLSAPVASQIDQVAQNPTTPANMAAVSSAPTTAVTVPPQQSTSAAPLVDRPASLPPATVEMNVNVAPDKNMSAPAPLTNVLADRPLSRPVSTEHVASSNKTVAMQPQTLHATIQVREQTSVASNPFPQKSTNGPAQSVASPAPPSAASSAPQVVASTSPTPEAMRAPASQPSVSAPVAPQSTIPVTPQTVVDPSGVPSTRPADLDPIGTVRTVTSAPLPVGGSGAKVSSSIVEVAPQPSPSSETPPAPVASRQAEGPASMSIDPEPSVNQAEKAPVQPSQPVSAAPQVAPESAAQTASAEPRADVGLFSTQDSASRSHETVLTQAQTAPSRPEVARDVARQLVPFISNAADGTVDIALNPKELGHVRMSLSISETGVTLIVQGERPETVELMRRHADELSASFREMGYENISFSFGSGGDAGVSQDDSAGEDSTSTPSGTDPTAALDTSGQPATAPSQIRDGGLDLRV